MRQLQNNLKPPRCANEKYRCLRRRLEVREDVYLATTAPTKDWFYYDAVDQQYDCGDGYVV